MLFAFKDKGLKNVTWKFVQQIDVKTLLFIYTYIIKLSDSSCSEGELSTGGSKSSSGGMSSLISCAVQKPLKSISSSSKPGVDSLADTFKVDFSNVVSSSG